MRTFIIAEVATTWLSPDWSDFSGLVKQCAACGVQAIKTQWVSDPLKMAARRKMVGDPYRYLNWPKAWMKDMARVCTDNGVEFMCTAYLSEDVGTVDLYVNRHKVASLEAQDTALTDAALNTWKHVLVSTGCMTYDEMMNIRQRYLSESIDRLLSESIDKAGVLRIDFTKNYPPELPLPAIARLQLMHCVCCYPVAMDKLALAHVSPWGGFSDHSGNTCTGMLAVASGARYLEVHVRHDLTSPTNPDFGHSLTTAQLKTYVDNVRLAERALGDGIKKIEECEEPLRGHRVIA